MPIHMESSAGVTAQLLEQHPLFYDFSHQDVRRIAALAEPVTFEPREPIFAVGDPGDCLFLVMSGLVRLSAHDTPAVQPDDFIVRSRAVFGEDCAVDESPRGFHAQALMRTECIVVTAQALRKLEEDHPRLALRLIRKLARTTSLRLRQAVGGAAGRARPERRIEREQTDPGRPISLLTRLLRVLRNPDRAKAVQSA